jgi:hypothetical protein
MIIPDLATFAQVSTEYHAALASVTKAEKTTWRQTLQLAIKSHLAEPLPDVTPQMLFGGCDLLAELLADPHQRRMLHQRGAATLELAKAPDMRPRDLFVTLREREPELEQALTAQGLIRPVLCSSRHRLPLLARNSRRYAVGSSMNEHGNGDEREGNHLGLARQEIGTC